MFQKYQPAPATPVAPAVITIKPAPACDMFASYRKAAAYWFNFGFNVIPIIPGKKIPAVKWVAICSAAEARFARGDSEERHA